MKAFIPHPICGLLRYKINDPIRYILINNRYKYRLLFVVDWHIFYHFERNYHFPNMFTLGDSVDHLYIDTNVESPCYILIKIK